MALAKAKAQDSITVGTKPTKDANKAGTKTAENDMQTRHTLPPTTKAPTTPKESKIMDLDGNASNDEENEPQEAVANALQLIHDAMETIRQVQTYKQHAPLKEKALNTLGKAAQTLQAQKDHEKNWEEEANHAKECRTTKLEREVSDIKAAIDKLTSFITKPLPKPNTYAQAAAHARPQAPASQRSIEQPILTHNDNHEFELERAKKLNKLKKEQERKEVTLSLRNTTPETREQITKMKEKDLVNLLEGKAG